MQFFQTGAVATRFTGGCDMQLVLGRCHLGLQLREQCLGRAHSDVDAGNLAPQCQCGGIGGGLRCVRVVVRGFNGPALFAP